MFEQTLFVPGEEHKKISFKPDIFWIKNLEKGSHFIVDSEYSEKTLSFDREDGYHHHKDGIIINNTPTVDFSSYIAAFTWKTKFMNKLSYTGDGIYGRTLYHDLKTEPDFALFKSTNMSSDWIAWHSSFSYKGYMKFNTDDDFIQDKHMFADKVHNRHAIYIAGEINKPGTEYMCYIFGKSEYFTSGFYSGVENNFVNTANRPDMLIIKRVDGTGSWRLFSRKLNPGDSLRINSFGGITRQDDLLNVKFSDKGFFIEKTSPALNKPDAKYIFLCFTQIS